MDITKRLNRRIGQLVKQSDRGVARQYANFLKDLRLLLGEYFDKYEKGGVLTYEELAKYNRIERLYKDINKQAGRNYDGLDKLLDTLLRDVYQEGYYMTTWGVQQEIEKFIPTALTSDQVLASVRNPISGLTLNDRLEKNRTLIEYSIRESVTKGLVEGSTYKTMMDDISKVVEGDKVKAMRIARTEAHRVVEEGKQDARDNMQSNGILISKEWISGADERVRESHKSLDGKVVGNDEYFETTNGRALYPGGFGVASEDINCRCTVIQKVTGVTKPNLKDVDKQSYDKYIKGGRFK